MRIGNRSSIESRVVLHFVWSLQSMFRQSGSGWRSVFWLTIGKGLRRFIWIVHGMISMLGNGTTRRSVACLEVTTDGEGEQMCRFTSAAATLSRHTRPSTDDVAATSKLGMVGTTCQVGIVNGKVCRRPSSCVHIELESLTRGNKCHQRHFVLRL